MGARAALWVGLATLAAATPAAARNYSLPELVSTVSSDYPGIVARREAVEVARSQLVQVQRLWMPTGDLFFSLAGTPQIQCLTTAQLADSKLQLPQALRERECVGTNLVDLTHGRDAGNVKNIAPIHGVLLNLSINLNQPLYSFGRFEAQIASAKANIEAQQAALAREEAEATFNAVRAYWGVKVAKSAVENLTEARDKLKDWVKRMDDEMNGDNPSRYLEGDLARLKIAMANLEIMLLDQQRNQSFAEHALRVMTRDPQATVDSGAVELDKLPESQLGDWQAVAEKTRPELRMNRASTRQSREVRKLRLSEMLPELTLTSTFGFGYASAMDTPQNWYMNQPSYLNATFALMLHQPLDFGVRIGRYQQADHDERQHQAQTQAAADSSTTEIAQAFANFEEARGRAEELARGERVARGWYNAIDQSSNTGLSGDSREMIDAARNYFEFRLRHLQAVFDTQVALANLRRIVGEKNVSAP
jgi:outer membrane protein TolC